MKTTTILTTRKRLTRSRVRAKVSGTATRPRLSVRISQLHITAQLIDDVAGKTLCSASTIGQKTLAKNTMTEKAEWVGTTIAEQALQNKITTITFDRGYRMYHGRVKYLAEAARAGGLTF